MSIPAENKIIRKKLAEHAEKLANHGGRINDLERTAIEEIEIMELHTQQLKMQKRVEQILAKRTPGSAYARILARVQQRLRRKKTR